jgi:hypothetical protein
MGFKLFLELKVENIELSMLTFVRSLIYLVDVQPSGASYFSFIRTLMIKTFKLGMSRFTNFLLSNLRPCLFRYTDGCVGWSFLPPE